MDGSCGTHYINQSVINCTQLYASLYSMYASRLSLNATMTTTASPSTVWNITDFPADIDDQLVPPAYRFRAFQTAVELYIISVLIAVGIVGNIVSIIVLRQDRERRDALFLLQALAVADALYLVAGILRYPLRFLISTAADGSNRYTDMQPTVFPFLKTFQTAAIWMMVLVTVDRFTCVCRPLDAPRVFNHTTRRRYAIAVFLASFLFNLPRFFDSCVVTFVEPCHGFVISTAMILRQVFHNDYYYDIYSFGLYLLLLYVGPLSVLVYMNFRLIQAIRYSRRRHLCRDSNASSSRTWSPSNDCTVSQTTVQGGLSGDRNATIVLIIIVAVFICCQTPELVDKLSSFGSRKFEDMDLPSHFVYLNIVSELLMILNSSVNFAIYVTFGRRFRRIMRETFRFSFRFSSMSTATTRASPQDGAAGGGGGGGAVGGPAGWQQVQQYNHNGVHAHRYQQPPIALRP